MAQTRKSVNSTALDLNNRFGSDAERFRFEMAEEAGRQLRDYTKNTTKTISTFDKTMLLGYLENIGSNETNLRNLSWYLYYRSQTYMRLCQFYANMFCLDVRSIIPNYDMTGKKNNANKILKSYQETVNTVELMRLQQEFYNIYLTCFVQDVFYGIWIQDETGVFVWQIPPDYAKIIGKYNTGDFSLAMDMSYFKRHQELIEYIPDPFENMYNEYLSSNQKWQIVPEEYAICIKYRSEDYETVLPPMVAIFMALINLSDLEEIQSTADAQSIYKMLWLELETINNSKSIDDWKVDPSLVVEYFNRLADGLPEYIGAAIVPGKLNEVSFPNDASSDTSKVSQATETVLNTAGGAEFLNGSTIKTQAAFDCARIANTEFAISSLLPQTQSFVNRQLSYLLSDPCKVKFMAISVYTKKQFKEDILSSGQYGLPTKLLLNTLNGFNEVETMALNYLEEDVLGLSDKLIPLNSSYTQSSKEDGYNGETGQGAPKKDDDELTDSGAKSRNG